MKKLNVQVVVTFAVEDHGEFDLQTLVDAIEDGILRNEGQGKLTKAEDTSTLIPGFALSATSEEY